MRKWKALWLWMAFSIRKVALTMDVCFHACWSRSLLHILLLKTNAEHVWKQEKLFIHITYFRFMGASMFITKTLHSAFIRLALQPSRPCFSSLLSTPFLLFFSAMLCLGSKKILPLSLPLKTFCHQGLQFWSPYPSLSKNRMKVR